MPRRSDQPTNSATRILDVAERLVQTRGFNGFSYADVAGELGVTAASLHYHFRGKADMGEALVRRYRTRFSDALTAVDTASSGARERLEAYARIYADVLRLGRLCLCGMLAAGYDTLPEAMRSELVRFFDENERWLVRVLEQGSAEGSLTLTGSAPIVAQSIISGLEGAMLVARPYGDVARFESAAAQLIGTIVGSGSRPATTRARTPRRTR